MIVVTDGKSGDSVASSANDLASQGVDVYAIGVGNYDATQLLEIAAGNQNNVIELTDFNALSAEINQIAQTVCAAAQTNPCQSNPCQNGGQCVSINNGQAYQCSCPTGFVGANCQTAVQCPTLSNPANGAVSYSSRNYGDVASYSCNTGYNLNGYSTRTCQSSGSWSYSAPTCGAAKLKNPSSLAVPELTNQVIASTKCRAHIGSLLNSISHNAQLQGTAGNNGITSLRVTVVCVSNTWGTIEHPVTVVVTDLNDNAPQFHPDSYFVEVNELTPVGITILDGFSVTDLDGTNEIKFKIVENEDDPVADEFFTIPLPKTGAIVVSRQLDYDSMAPPRQYRLKVEAWDTSDEQDPSKNTAHTIVTVNITDGDDLGPLFEPCCDPVTYMANVTEKSEPNFLNPIPVSPNNIAAVDQDKNIQPVEERPNIVYSFFSGSPSVYREYLSIDNRTGDIILQRAVNREDYQTFSIVVKAEQDRNDPKPAYANLLITVLDLNDHTPEFDEREYVGFVGENSVAGTTVVTREDGAEPLEIRAMDLDGTEVMYSLLNYTDKFRLRPVGDVQYLIITQSLDREEQDTYELSVMASDGELTNMTTVVVTVVDRNDFTPQFHPPGPYITRLKDDALAGHVVYELNVTDGDGGAYGEVTFSILHVTNNGENKFAVQERNGTVTLEDESLLTGEVYTLTVMAADGAPEDERKYGAHIVFYLPSLQCIIWSSVTTLEVRVIPANNQSRPTFDPARYYVSISEGAQIGTSLTTVHAFDAEGEPLHFGIADGNPDNTFNISSKVGQIILNKELDREDIPAYTLIVLVDDGNENGLNVTDGDGGAYGEVTFSILHVTNNGENKFAVQERNGTVTLEDESLLTGEVYTLTVMAADGAPEDERKSSVTTLEVRVIPANNQSRPTFDPARYYVSISEGAQIGTSLTTVHAFDAEGEPLHFGIADGNPDNTFNISSKVGQIILNKELDREDIPAYTLIVLVDDGNENGTATATVEVVVTDINDNNPIFNSSFLTEFTIQEEQDPPVLIGRVESTDADIGAKGEVEYHLVSSSFEISPVGAIYATQRLDREEQDQYVLVVTANDKAPDGRSSSVTLTVNVTDINDNSPQFPEDLYEVVLDENENATVLLTLQATDADLDPSLTYSIADGDTSMFTIDSTTGQLSNLQPLDFEMDPEYTLVVQADDGQNQGNTTVIVAVNDMNEFAPVFSQNVYTAEVLDNAVVGTIVTTVNATDNDVKGTPSAQVLYRLADEDSMAAGLFRVDRVSGVVTSRVNLRESPGDTYQLAVEAYDGGDPVMSSQTTVNITVLSSDTRPVFQKNLYEVPSLSENTPVGTDIVNVFAEGAAAYSIERGNAEGIFRIDSGGVVYVNKTLDHEAVTSYRLLIRAYSDQPMRKRRRRATETDDPDYAEILIALQDENDNPPVFTQDNGGVPYLRAYESQEVKMEIPEGTDPNEQDVVFQAEDGSFYAIQMRNPVFDKGTLLYSSLGSGSSMLYEADTPTSSGTYSYNIPKIPFRHRRVPMTVAPLISCHHVPMASSESVDTDFESANVPPAYPPAPPPDFFDRDSIIAIDADASSSEEESPVSLFSTSSGPLLTVPQKYHVPIGCVRTPSGSFHSPLSGQTPTSGRTSFSGHPLPSSATYSKFGGLSIPSYPTSGYTSIGGTPIPSIPCSSGTPFSSPARSGISQNAPPPSTTAHLPSRREFRAARGVPVRIVPLTLASPVPRNGRKSSESARSQSSSVGDSSSAESGGDSPRQGRPRRRKSSSKGVVDKISFVDNRSDQRLISEDEPQITPYDEVADVEVESTAFRGSLDVQRHPTTKYQSTMMTTFKAPTTATEDPDIVPYEGPTSQLHQNQSTSPAGQGHERPKGRHDAQGVPITLL
uniref:Protocadherin Fat 4 n=1 Tax=Branchiostoma floridae TaxID=7739 RepID=C3XQB0_BRAFL|eukprot:XP_002613714.1 hypothetical protein BRAFLDRAFT_130689 [Branchiostoma floridae]